MLCFDKKKDASKVKNTLLQRNLQNILENQTFQRIAKFILVDSYEMDFVKGIVILAKVGEMYLEVCQPVYWSKDEDAIGCSKFLLESALECPYIYYAPPLLRCMPHFVRDIAAEKEFDIAIQMAPDHVSSEIQENRNG